MSESHRGLSIVLLVTGLAFLVLYPAMMLMPGLWTWEPRQHEYEQMIVGVYFVLGIFTVVAARAPTRHLSLIWFVAVSNVVHGAIMLVQALVDPADRVNLMGDVPALIASGLAIAWLAPKRLGGD
jgi:uncharacterized membrane protein